jgi:hypothetical protein
LVAKWVGMEEGLGARAIRCARGGQAEPAPILNFRFWIFDLKKLK